MSKKLIVSLALLASSISFAQSQDNFDPLAVATTGTTPTGPIFQRVPAAILFDQGPVFTQTGTPNNLSILNTTGGANYCTLGFSAATGVARLADDFTVPAGQTWTVDRVVVFGYQTGGTAPSITSGTLRILSTSPGLSATPTVVFGDSTTNRVTPANVTLSGTVRVSSTTLTATNRLVQAIPLVMSPAVVLPAGTYWIDFDAAGSVASGPFFPPLSPVVTAPTANGNAFNGLGGSVYPAVVQNIANAANSCAPADVTPGPAHGIPFIVEGTSGTIGAPTITPVTPAGAVSFTLPATRSFVFNNAAGATASGTVSCAIAGAGFSVNPATVQTIPIGGSSTFVVSAAAAGTGTLSCVVQGIAQPVVYNLTAGAPVVLIPTPTLSLWSALALLMGLGLFGALTVRRFS